MYSGSEDTVEEKRQDVFKLNDEEKHTESIEIEKQPKKEIRDFLHAGKEMLSSTARSAQTIISIIVDFSCV